MAQLYSISGVFWCNERWWTFGGFFSCPRAGDGSFNGLLVDLHGSSVIQGLFDPDGKSLNFQKQYYDGNPKKTYNDEFQYQLTSANLDGKVFRGYYSGLGVSNQAQCEISPIGRSTNLLSIGALPQSDDLF